MSFFKLTVSYDGAEFCGWQSQTDQRTVQDELERAWLEITGEKIRFFVAGRTDAGVHAVGQVASVESGTVIPPDVLMLGLNAKLPEDMAVRGIESLPAAFHATRDAQAKHYRYEIYNDRRRPVFCRRYAWHIPMPLDVAAMHAAAQYLVGTHDFFSFQSAGSVREKTVRTIYSADVTSGAGQGRGGAPPSEVTRLPSGAGASSGSSEANPPAHARQNHRTEADALIAIDLRGDGFLYNMVRSIAGTLVEVGRGRRDPQWIADVIVARDRTAAGQTAPPHGLTLMRVEY